MSIRSPQYAGLSDNAYENRRVGVREGGDREQVVAGGVVFEVREHVDNKLTGYQGTIYERVDTGEIVIAHRGTEAAKDGIADASMVSSRFNPQAADALALTRDALSMARTNAVGDRQVVPVTVTGHSLGGTLAQITAHHFNLKGETFNAYGAASLGLRIPSGGDTVVNHVMATDAVSAASPHFGQV
ncbi:lipase, partial [Stenotrophomonas sp. C3(2023)]|nr:lipase [Stenotrophomonas sp. C3(2023)]